MGFDHKGFALSISLESSDVHRILALKSLKTIELSFNSVGRELVPHGFSLVFSTRCQQFLSTCGLCLDVAFEFEHRAICFGLINLGNS